jgi:CheY-like chemotaxis protein
VSRILVVANRDAARDELVDALRRAPHTVKAVSPADLAIANAREWEPDLIVMQVAAEDAALPLRISMLRDPSLSQIPFIAIGDSEAEARALGANAWVSGTASIEGVVGLLNRFAALQLPLPEG